MASGIKVYSDLEDGEQWPGPVGMASPSPVSSIKNIYLCVCSLCVGACACAHVPNTLQYHSTHVEVRGQLAGVSSVVLSHGSWGLNPGHLA